ncbi:uncharacterized protein [Ambystoma mexicanum]|uniref:uncharacterized protein isoform X2 n=1 Tax=Ambystoma mexicanum TaxID=8296 RepID=UPI0037E8FE2F
MGDDAPPKDTPPYSTPNTSSALHTSDHGLPPLPIAIGSPPLCLQPAGNPPQNTLGSGQGNSVVVTTQPSVTATGRSTDGLKIIFCSLFTTLFCPLLGMAALYYGVKQVQEALPMRYTGPGHSLEPGSLVLIKNFERKTALAPRWHSPYQVLLATQMAIRVDGRKAWIHATHAKRFPALLTTSDDKRKETVSETKETVASPVPQHQPKREVKLETEPEEAASKGKGQKVPQRCSVETTSLPSDTKPALQTRAETTRVPLWRPPVPTNAPKPKKETTSLPRRSSLPIIVPQADTEPDTGNATALFTDHTIPGVNRYNLRPRQAK